MRLKKKVLCIVLAISIAFIFGQSMLNQRVSNFESNTVKMAIVKPVYEIVTGKTTLPHNIRDVAHIFEFAVLGFVITLLLTGKKPAVRFLQSVSYCGLVALIDESIQVFTSRTPQIVDVWIDICGAIIGATIVITLSLMRRLFCRRKVTNSRIV